VSVSRGWQGLSEPAPISKPCGGWKRNLPEMHQRFIRCAYNGLMETNTRTSRKTTRQGVFNTLKSSGWTQHTSTSTSIRGYRHDNAGWKVSNAKAGQPIIVWHIKDSVAHYQADTGERLSSYAYELRKAGYDAQIINEPNKIPYIKVNR